MNAPISNRAPGPGHWYQIEVSGTHPAGTNEDGSARVQVIDAQALRSIVDAFNRDRAEAGENWPGILVDRDHLSHDLDNSTEALAWLQEVALRSGQLWGRLDLSDLGTAAIRNKRYKFFSTEYAGQDLEDLGNGRVRPLRLSGLAFTNRPNNRGAKPISNRGRSGAGRDNETNNNTTKMQKIAEKLGLSAEATEEDILSKIDDLMNQAAEYDAEAVMNRHADRIPADKRDEVKAALIANRADGLEKILGFPTPPPAEKPEAKGDDKPVHNRAEATTPDPVEKTERKSDKADEKAEAKKAAAIANRAGELRAANPNLSRAEAFRRAQAEL